MHFTSHRVQFFIIAGALTLLLTPQTAQADGAPSNIVWEFIWTMACSVPIFRAILGCNGCKSVVEGADPTCQMKLIDTTNDINVLVEARDIGVGAFEVTTEANGENPRTVSLLLSGWWDKAIFTGSDLASALPQTNCAKIVLGYDKDEEFEVPSRPDFLPVEGHACSEYGMNLVWLLIIEDWYYADVIKFTP